MYCRICGAQLPEESIFCYKCGTKVISEFNNKEEYIEKKTEQNAAASVNTVKAENYTYSNATNIKQNNSVGTLNDIGKQEMPKKKRINKKILIIITLVIMAIAATPFAIKGVEMASAKVTLSNGSLSMETEDTFYLKAHVSSDIYYESDIQWESSNNDVVKVDANGKLTATMPGNATITGKLPNGRSDSCSVVVTHEVVEVSNGEIIVSPHRERVAPVEIHASKDESCYVYFDSIESNDRDISVFVEAGKTATFDAPLGRYVMYYATGETWYGKKYKFGGETSYYTTDEIFEFYEKDDYVYGTELTLYTVSNGNMDTEEIELSDFPG